MYSYLFTSNEVWVTPWQHWTRFDDPINPKLLSTSSLVYKKPLYFSLQVGKRLSVHTILSSISNMDLGLRS
jgi:hypothetical protein